MIELRKHLYESLLDDEEDLIDRVDSDIYNDILNDLTGDLYKDYHGEGLIKEPAKLIDGHILNFENFNSKNSLIVGQRGNNKEFKPITHYIPDADTLESNGYIYVYPVNNLTDDTICKNIKCPKLYIILKDGQLIKNINIISADGGYVNTHIEPIINKIKLENVTFEGGRENYNVLNFKANTFPEFKNVTVPPKTRIEIYDITLDMGSDISKIINSILDPKYKMTVYDNNKNEDVLRDVNVKKIQAVLSNTKRYQLKTELFHFKHGVKMSDIIPNLPKNVYTVRIRNNKMEMNFTNMKNVEKSSSLFCQFTDDNWRLEFYPK